MQELIQPVLIVNKIDRTILELQVDGEKMYEIFVKVIDGVNNVIGTYVNEKAMGKIVLNPTIGNVSFGSGKD